MSGGFVGSNGPGTTDGTGTAGAIGKMRRVQRDGRPADPSEEQDAPSGAIIMFAGDVAPAGWYLLDGQAVSRTDEPDLFAVCGETYGAGDGSTTFNLPDMRGTFPVGVGNEFLALNQRGGDIEHSHDLNGLRAGAQLEVTDAGSLMAITRTAPTGPWMPNTRVNGTANAAYSQRTRSVDLTGRTETTAALPPYLSLNFIIRA